MKLVRHLRKPILGLSQDTELAVSLLYELGEGAPEEALKPGTGELGQLALGLMQTDVPASGHRLVALALMESYVRYSRVLQQNTQCLPKVLEVFLGDKGIGHPDKVYKSSTLLILYCCNMCASLLLTELSLVYVVEM